MKVFTAHHFVPIQFSVDNLVCTTHFHFYSDALNNLDNQTKNNDTECKIYIHTIHTSTWLTAERNLCPK